MINILIAGIGGASLGTEIAKALRLAGGYKILGCDVSPLAFGHYTALCDETLLMPRDGYIDKLLDIVQEHSVQVVIPGADETMKKISVASERFAQAGIRLAMNSPDIVRRLSDKEQCFLELARLGIAIPRTIGIHSREALAQAPYPCVIKPSRDSGGSAFVFFARTLVEAELYFTYLKSNGKSVLLQEYIPHIGGEFTVGVLSSPDGYVIDAIALRRSFPAKLSILSEGDDFLISSGYTQGRIGYYPEVCSAARAIAAACGSMGPLNIQGRVDGDGRFLPFEINPRFSASTHLRALAGFNEVDHFIRTLIGDPEIRPLTIQPGWCLRSLTEVVVPDERVVT